MNLVIAVPTNKNEPSGWWSAVFGELLRLTSHEGIEVEALLTSGGALTDTNRNKCTESFLTKTTADAIAWIDDDTIPPPGSFQRLLELDADIANAVYYLRGEPYNPVAYRRMPNRKYLSLREFQPGQIVELDSVGMGCTIVRRHVYEEINKHYDVYMRWSIAAPIAIHKDDVSRWPTAQWKDEELPDAFHDVGPGAIMAPEPGIRGYYIDPIVGPLDEEDYDRFPYYALEWGRTEDHFFCEMARRVGMTIKTDTWRECKHLGTTGYDGSQYRDVLDQVTTYLGLKGMMQGGQAESARGGVAGGERLMAGQRDNEDRGAARLERAV